MTDEAPARAGLRAIPRSKRGTIGFDTLARSRRAVRSRGMRALPLLLVASLFVIATIAWLAGGTDVAALANPTADASRADELRSVPREHDLAAAAQAELPARVEAPVSVSVASRRAARAADRGKSILRGRVD